MRKAISDLNIGGRIDALLKLNNITRLKLSEDTGVPYTTLTQIINGRTKNPQMGALWLISEYFGVPIDYLLGKIEIPIPNRFSAIVTYRNKNSLAPQPASDILEHMKINNPKEYEGFSKIPNHKYEPIDPETFQVTRRELYILEKFRDLDEKGKHTVETVLLMEHNRNRNALEPIAAHNDDHSEEQQRLMEQDIEDL